MADPVAAARERALAAQKQDEARALQTQHREGRERAAALVRYREIAKVIPQYVTSEPDLLNSFVRWDPAKGPAPGKYLGERKPKNAGFAGTVHLWRCRAWHWDYDIRVLETRPVYKTIHITEDCRTLFRLKDPRGTFPLKFRDPLRVADFHQVDHVLDLETGQGSSDQYLPSPDELAEAIAAI